MRIVFRHESELDSLKMGLIRWPFWLLTGSGKVWVIPSATRRTHVVYRKMGLVAAALALGLSVFAGSAKAEDNPTPQMIVNKYIKATGGEDAWKSVKSRSSKAKLVVVSMGMNGTMTQYVEGKNAKNIMALEGFGEFQSGMKDGKMWNSSPMQGDNVLEGAEAEAAAKQFDLADWLHWEKYYPKAETVGEEAIGDKKCWKVIFTPAKGDASTDWFDKESGLLIQSVGPGFGGGPATTTYKDYKQYGPIKAPSALAIEGANGPVEITFESIEINGKIDPKNFETPEGITKLLAGGGKPAGDAAKPADKPAAKPADKPADKAAAPAAPKK
jgi:hypothetical protein